jgi:hypothetical protein
LHRPVPLASGWRRFFSWLLLFFESRSRQTFDPHWVCYLGNHCSQWVSGFVSIATREIS